MQPVKISLPLLRTFAVVLIATLPISAHSGESPLEKVYAYCQARETTTDMMARGRDTGIGKATVIAQLPALNPSSNDAERATFARLNDVYDHPELKGRTLFHYRVAKCLLNAMYNKEPSFDDSLGSELRECQTQSNTDEALGGCVATVTTRLFKKGR
jgi:hypothetical protein